MTSNLKSLEEVCAEALRRDPGLPAVEFENETVSWGNMRKLADQLTDLLQQSGAGNNPVVAFVARNHPSALAAFLGLLKNRCTLHMVYPFQSADAIAKKLEEIKPSVVVAAQSDYSNVVTDTLNEHDIAGIALSGMQALSVPGREKTSRTANASGSPQIILLTSGTTGPPKSFGLDYETVCTYYTGNVSAASPVPVDSNQAVLLYFPVSNISGLYTTLPALILDQPIVLLDRFNLDAWREFVKRFQPVFFGMPPAGYKMVLDADIHKEELSSIRAMGAGAAPLDPVVHKAFQDRYGIPILLSYGATEFGGPVVNMTADLLKEWGDKKLGSVGKPIQGMDARIVDAESGEELAAGNEGIVEVISCRIGSDWIRTSDIGIIDEDGFLFLRGRADGAIMRGGFKILPSTIEQGLIQNDAIAMASVVGVPDERLGQVPAAAIVLKPEARTMSINDIEADLRKHVLATHIPVKWKFLDALPRTPSMKVDVPAIKSLFEVS